MPKHIARLIMLIGVGLGVYLGAKWYLTPQSFYEEGHYRADSVAEIAARKVAFQGAESCRDCHAERHAQWSANNHKSVACEVCHGPARGHPQEERKLPVPADARKLCSLCHAKMAERPATQPQVDLAQHNATQQCVACHNPHSPKLAGVVAKVAGDAAAGRAKHAASCASCHGASGVSPNDSWPNLAGQNAAYLVRILGAYKSGAQTDPMMSPVAKGLSDADIQNLAAYLGSLGCQAAAIPAPAGDPAAGKSLARNCAACHGESGVAGNPAWPHLAGQKAVYLANTLKAFRGGLRKDPTMAAATRALSDADIANLAAYYAAQSCRPAPQAGKPS